MLYLLVIPLMMFEAKFGTISGHLGRLLRKGYIFLKAVHLGKC